MSDRRPSDRYYDDYDDEEEEEMDDFIDDDNNYVDDDVPDVSQHIREIFGYDKRKYADFDDDDIEESSYAQVQKEEMRSAKIGRKEDLEDMRMELMKKKEKRKQMARD
jgi:protein SPT2